MRTPLAALLTGCLLATSLHAQLNDIPNAIKYRDTSKPHAKGRSGSASLEARALLGSDGVTELAVTTGSLETGAPAPGNIDKVQLKVADTARNYNALSAGGTFTQSLTGLGRNEPLQIQANVSGIDPNRMDVVTVTETVKLRPDLAVEQLLVQPHAAIGVPLRVNAVLRERNGDVGARANCVLLANGTAVDRANNLWIDANGTVSCQFVHTFEATGAQELQVALTDVNPGDYDAANNSATASVNVYATTSQLPQWWASAEERTWVSASKSSSYYQEAESSDAGWQRMTMFSAGIEDYPGSVDAIRISYQESHDGNTVVDIADAQWTDGWRYCRYAQIGDTNVEKCVIPPGPRGPSHRILTIDVSRGGGEAVYRSRGWYLSYNWSTGTYDRYTINHDHTSTWGNQAFQLGNSIAMTVRMSDATTFYEATPFITMAPSETNFERPWSCFTDWTGNPNCSSYSYRSSGRYGSAGR